MEFEFDFGSPMGAPATGQQKNAPLYASVSGVAAPLSHEEVVFFNPQDGQSHVMTHQVLEALAVSRDFQPLAAHIDRVAQQIPALKGQKGAIAKVFEYLQKKGTMLSDEQWLQGLRATSSDSDGQTAPKPFGGIAIRTCDRPEQLQRILESLSVYQQRFGHQWPVHVFDDSREEKNHKLNEKICRDSPLAVQHHGPVWQRSFLAMLEREFPQHKATINWLIKPDSNPSLFSGGRIWNLALLALAGKTMLFFDDDFLMEPRQLQSQQEQAPAVDFSVNAQLGVSFALNLNEIQENTRTLEADVLSDLIATVGQPLHQWLQRAPETVKSLQGQPLAELQRLHANSPIKLTGNGTWGSPRAESNYWLYFLSGEQQQAFWQSRDVYLDNIEASHLMHYSPDYQALSLGQFAPSGIDNTELTPFSMPLDKNEDHFFNGLMLYCYPDQVALNFPWMLGHVQNEKRRRSGMNHIARRPNFNLFVTDFLLSKSDQCEAHTPAQRMAVMAETLASLADADFRTLANRLQEYMIHVRANIVSSLQEQLAKSPDAPIYWQADVRELIEANGKAIASNQPPVFRGWPDDLDLAACVDRAREELSAIAAGARVWPQLWEFCRSQ
jgi:hypothetical protein